MRGRASLAASVIVLSSISDLHVGHAPSTRGAAESITTRHVRTLVRVPQTPPAKQRAGFSATYAAAELACSAIIAPDSKAHKRPRSRWPFAWP